MTPCEHLSDRMPEVALGRSQWSADEARHLDGCADCLAEWRLVQTAGRLGSSLPPGQDADVIAAAVLGRLSGERTAARVRRRNWLVAGLAAAAVAIIAVRIPRSPAGTSPTAPSIPRVSPATANPPVAPGPVAAAVSPALPLPELEDLPAAELESILGALDDSQGISAPLDGPGLDDVDDHELERALSAWEG